MGCFNFYHNEDAVFQTHVIGSAYGEARTCASVSRQRNMDLFSLVDDTCYFGIKEHHVKNEKHTGCAMHVYTMPSQGEKISPLQALSLLAVM